MTVQKRKRLAILTTHQIQYHVPWFRGLSVRPELDLEVIYCHSVTSAEQASAGFGVEFNWDISLSEDYRHRFLQNVARKPGLSGFWGLDTPEIHDLIRDGHYDAVLINGWHYKSAWQAIRACWHNHTPVMVRSDSHLHTTRGFAKRAAKRPVYSWFIPRLNACLAVGTWSRNYFKHYGAKDEQLFVVPHAIDDQRFRNSAVRLRSNRTELRNEFGLPSDAIVFLFAGKFVETKRPLTFVDAIGQAAKQNARVAGLMAGDGPLRQACEDFAREHNVPVRFPGFLNQSEIIRAYVAADALVIPSENETWGLVVNESMTCGLPALVSDQVGCGPDLVSSGETGDVFLFGDAVDLAAKILHYSQQPRLLAEMGRKARSRIADYSVDHAVDSTLTAVSAVIGRC
jgi:glycosyltransferase involved in cell wall biosynthesis